jgi:hypothetical protein
LGQFTKNCRIFTPKIVIKVSKIWFGIRDPEKNCSGSRIQGSKRYLPDPGSGSATLCRDDVILQVGHVERNMYRAGGASCTLLQPLLDNQVGLKNMENCPKVSIPLEKVRSHLCWRR